jgi:dipeptidyl-peptidase 4
MKSIFNLSLFALFSFVSIIGLAQGQQLTNELIWYSQEFSGKSVSGINSMADGIHYTSQEWSEANGSEIVKYSYETGKKVGVIATSKDIFKDATKKFDGYAFSPNETQLLITTDTEYIYRHSYEANYYTYDITSKKAYPLTDFALGKQRLAEYSPTGKLVAFVRDNNIFIHNIEFREDEQITFDGKKNEIINGYPDWVYEEEFGFNKGFYWSPKGDRIAYYKFDESKVKEFQMAMYGGLYPDQNTFKYPKAGEANSVTSVYVYDLNAMTSKRVDAGKKKDQYIPRIKWTKNNDKLCIMRMNRQQNQLDFLVTDLSTSQPFELKADVFFTEKSDTYLEVGDDLTFLADGSSFIVLSQRDGFNHLYQFDMTGNVVRQITQGEWDVTQFCGIDEDKGIVYFVSGEESPLERHVYSQGLKKSGAKKLTENKGSNDPVFSSGYKYFINYHTDANTPALITLLNSKGKEIRVLEDNSALRANIKKYNFQKKEFFQFTNSGGTALNCWMIKPPNFDASKKYPVFVYVYGGPSSNTVQDSWAGSNLLWHQLLAQQGYIVVSCDPRGTGMRGRDFAHCTYMQLGKFETEDLIEFGKHMQSQPYVDGGRIGIQGWSYGGYMSSLCMTKGADVYSAGIAVAPVTNWRYYDTIYTERFMRTPQENAEGYDNNSPINFVSELKGAYFLVHGSADDNVHYQNSMEMIDALVKENKSFDMFIYPNKNHGIYGGTTRMHLFEKMTTFLKENL